MKLRLRLMVMTFSVISAVAMIIGSIIIGLRWAVDGQPPNLTNQDIAELTRLNLQYQLPFWWELIAIWLWFLMLYGIIVSRHLKRKLGLTMKIAFFFLVMVPGIYFAFQYHGIMYGFIVSFFMAVCPPILLFLAFLYRQGRRLFFSSDD